MDVTDIYAARAAVKLAAADAPRGIGTPAVYASFADLVDQIEDACGRGDTAAALEVGMLATVGEPGSRSDHYRSFDQDVWG